MNKLLKLFAFLFIFCALSACDSSSSGGSNNDDNGDNDSNPFVGTWLMDGYNREMVFTDSDYSVIVNDENQTKGTYTYTDTTITMTQSHTWNTVTNSWDAQIGAADEFTYVISGNTVAFTDSEGVVTYTKE